MEVHQRSRTVRKRSSHSSFGFLGSTGSSAACAGLPCAADEASLSCARFTLVGCRPVPGGEVGVGVVVRFALLEAPFSFCELTGVEKGPCSHAIPKPCRNLGGEASFVREGVAGAPAMWISVLDVHA